MNNTLHNLIKTLNKMEKNNKQNNKENNFSIVKNSADHLIKWFNSNKKQRAFILLAHDDKTGETVISECGTGKQLSSIIACSMDNDDDFKNNIKLGFLMSSLHGILGDDE